MGWLKVVRWKSSFCGTKRRKRFGFSCTLTAYLMEILTNQNLLFQMNRRYLFDIIDRRDEIDATFVETTAEQVLMLIRFGRRSLLTT